MNNHTAIERKKQTKNGRKCRAKVVRTTMTAEQRKNLIEWAWFHAQPIIRYREKQYGGPDYPGAVAERLSNHIDRFDAGISSLSHWAQREAIFACQDACREETGIIHIPRKAKYEKLNGVQLDCLYFQSPESGRRDAPNCLAIRDAPGHLEQVDAFRDLLRGANRKERILLIGYYWQGRTMREIGEDLDLSESRIHQMHAAIIARLRERLDGRMPAA